MGGFLLYTEGLSGGDQNVMALPLSGDRFDTFQEDAVVRADGMRSRLRPTAPTHRLDQPVARKGGEKEDAMEGDTL
jgi:hypothetical protein